MSTGAHIDSIADARGLLAGLIEHSPVAFQVYRADGHCVFVNHAFLDLFGAAPPPEYNVLQDDVLESRGFLELVRQAFAGGTVRVPAHWYDPREIRQLDAPGGHRVGVQVTLFPLRDLEGNVEHIALCFEDVTAELELRSTAEALEHSEERFRATFEQAAVGIAHVAPDGRWLEVNQRLCDIVGYTREELLAITFQHITYAPDLGADLELVQKLLASESSTYTLEKRYVRKNGEVVWIDLTVSLVRDEAGAPKYFISLVQDISARKKTEQALAESTKNLEAEIVERERAERELRESEEGLATTLASIGDAVIATDTQGNVTRMNPVAEALTGWTVADATGRHLREVFHIVNEDSPERVPSPVDRVLREGVVVGLANHTLLISRSGASCPIADSGAPIRDASGRLRGVVLVFRDQTEERRIERAIRESDARKGAILEAAFDSIVSVDHTGAITEFNPAAERMFGYLRSDVVGKPLVELIIPPSLRQRHLQGFDHYLKTGEGAILRRLVELPALRADGSEFPVELAVAPLRLDGPPAFTAYIRDITQRREAAQALEVSQARFKHLAESGIIGILITDTLGNIHEANEEFLRMVGHSREDLVSGKVRWPEMTPPEWAPLDRAAVAELEATGIARPWKKEYLRKDGSRVPVAVGVAMLDGPSCIAFALDLTEQKRAEEVGARAIALAERESAERERTEQTLRETEAQLRHSQKMEAIGAITGGIAHDFNNLLSVVLSYAELLSHDLQRADPMRADLDEIARAGRRAADLTAQLLAFSRQQVLQPSVVNLNDIVAGMTQMLRRVIGEDVDLTFSPTLDLSPVFVDAGQIEQVLMNLIVNARDAMPEGGRLTIETANVVLDAAYSAEHFGVESGRYVMMSVSDTGVGMDRATRERIFDPFFTTKEKGKGTGLGLSTVFGIIKQSGGHVWVYSEPNHGTTFKIYLPYSEESADTSPPAPLPPVALRGSETVLLVEDDEQVRTLAHAILERNGYHVLEATSGGDALLICERYEGKIHVLLTDVVMPRMSGGELWKRLQPIRPDMKALFMSGYTDDAIVRHGVLSLALPFVQKPLMPKALLAKLRAVLDDDTED
jgi:two-component system, cell cycle sensor histidine kinase and response regulator CckA